MKMSDLNVLIVDDDVFKAVNIKRALMANDIRDIHIVRCQEDVWDEIKLWEKNGKQINLIVTDMNYPLTHGAKTEQNAGFILLEQLYERKLEIPVIICSTRNFHSEDALGTVWYSELKDIEAEFKKMLQKMCQ